MPVKPKFNSSNWIKESRADCNQKSGQILANTRWKQVKHSNVICMSTNETCGSWEHTTECSVADNMPCYF